VKRYQVSRVAEGTQTLCERARCYVIRLLYILLQTPKTNRCAHNSLLLSSNVAQINLVHSFKTRLLRPILISDSHQLSGVYKHWLLASQERHCSKKPVAYLCILYNTTLPYKKLNSRIFSPKRLCVSKWCLAQKTDVVSIRLV